MVISKLNLNRIEENLNLIGDFLEKLERLSKLSMNEFLADERNPAAAESFLRRCIETIFDIGRHILAKSFTFKPLEYKEITYEELYNILQNDLRDIEQFLVEIDGFLKKYKEQFKAKDI